MLFPTAPRRAVEASVRNYRSENQKNNQVKMTCTYWFCPNAVWSMDFVIRKWQPVDGRFPYVIAVRDLSSRRELAFEGILDKTAKCAMEVLNDLFLRFGPPLVLKAYNDGPFIADEMRDFLEKKWGVCLLLSYSYYPQYNGAIEGSNGSMKKWTNIEAAREGHPGWWNSGNLESARYMVNCTMRPFGMGGPTPDAAYRRGKALTPEIRTKFFNTVQAMRELVRKEQDFLLPYAVLLVKDRASIDRVAIPCSLKAYGFLKERERVFCPPIFSQKTPFISC
jgi:hypothetical protein